MHQQRTQLQAIVYHPVQGQRSPTLARQRPFALQCSGLARQLPSVQVQPLSILCRQLGDLRSSGSEHLHGPDVSIGSCGDGFGRFRHFPTTRHGHRSQHFPTSVVSSQLYVGVYGFDSRFVRREGGLCTRRSVVAQLHDTARTRLQYLCQGGNRRLLDTQRF